MRDGKFAPGVPRWPRHPKHTAFMFEWAPVAARLVFLLTNTRTFQLLEASGSLKIRPFQKPQKPQKQGPLVCASPPQFRGMTGNWTTKQNRGQNVLIINHSQFSGVPSATPDGGFFSESPSRHGPGMDPLYDTKSTCPLGGHDPAILICT